VGLIYSAHPPFAMLDFPLFIQVYIIRNPAEDGAGRNQHLLSPQRRGDAEKYKRYGFLF
jgi:hypothetical protein